MKARAAAALRRLRRAKLRTRVLAGVLAVTLPTLVAFDIAAVAALRGYLLGRVDGQLATVLRQYTVQELICGPHSPFKCSAVSAGTIALGPVFTPAQPPAGQRRVVAHMAASAPASRKTRAIVGPLLSLPGIFGQYYVASTSIHGKGVFIKGGPGLVPSLPGGLAALAKSGRGVTVPNQQGTGQLRLMAETFPRYGVVYVTTSLAEVNRTVGQLSLILIIGSAAAGLLAAAGVVWVTRRGLRSIEVMAGQADKINAGDLTERVSPADSRTEVGRLGTAINEMLARVQEFVAEREASQEATRRFFADASHELRTPLASLRANAELYQQGALPRRDQVDEAMRRITVEAQRMGGLVDDLLRLARLDQQPFQRRAERREPVDLSDLVEECVQRARTADPRRTWRSSVDDGLEVAGDGELLRRAIDNMLANVTAHTGEGSTASVTAAERGGEVVVEVADDGPGVPAAQLSRIFERFHRAAAPATRPGSGLGLAIVAATAAAHRGSVGAARHDPHGLRITLALPATGRSCGPAKTGGAALPA